MPNIKGREVSKHELSKSMDKPETLEFNALAMLHIYVNFLKIKESGLKYIHLCVEIYRIVFREVYGAELFLPGPTSPRLFSGPDTILGFGFLCCAWQYDLC